MDPPAANRMTGFVGLATISSRMAIISNYPIHVNAAYRDRPDKVAVFKI